MHESIVIEGLSKYYDDFLALDNLSLKVRKNEDVALLGPNGAGETTTLKLLCGLLRPGSFAHPRVLPTSTASTSWRSASERFRKLGHLGDP